MKTINRSIIALTVAAMSVTLYSCKPKGPAEVAMGDAASKVYVAPGKYDEFYNIVSGGFNGQMAIYGIPSGRLFRIIPVFSQSPESGYGFSEETKPMLNTSHGYVPWDDLHHIALSQTKGEHDGRWAFGNGNNTPRIARVDLTTFETDEILEIPNVGGNHSSPFITENTEYIVASSRFSVPIGSDQQRDVAINTYKENFKGTVSFISVGEDGDMKIAFQLVTPGVNFD